MSSVINRRPTGTPRGRPVRPTLYREPAVALCGPSFDSAFEADQGQMALKPLQVVCASGYPDLLVECYGRYFADSEAEADPASATENLRQALSDLYRPAATRPFSAPPGSVSSHSSLTKASPTSCVKSRTRSREEGCDSSYDLIPKPHTGSAPGPGCRWRCGPGDHRGPTACG